MPGSDFRIDFNRAQFMRVRNELRHVRFGANRVLARSLNRAAEHGRTHVVRMLSRKSGLPAKEVRKYVPKIKGGNRATYTRMNATIFIGDRRISLSRFDARQIRMGVSWKSGEGRKRVPGAFKLLPAGSKRGEANAAGTRYPVVKRKTKGRFPLRKLKGPSMGAVAHHNPSGVRAVMRKVSAYLAKEIDRNLKFVLGRR